MQRVLALPPEILKHCVSFVENYGDACSLSHANHFFQTNTWEQKFKTCFPDLYIKYSSAEYKQYIPYPIDWKRQFTYAFLKYCLCFSKKELKDYWAIRNCQIEQIKEILSAENGVERLFSVVDMQRQSVWYFLENLVLQDSAKAQEIYDHIFMAIYKDYLAQGYHQEETVYGGIIRERYSLHFQIINMQQPSYSQSMLLRIAVMCNQVKWIDHYLQMIIKRDGIDVASSLCRSELESSVLYNSKETFEFFYNHIKTRQNNDEVLLNEICLIMDRLIFGKVKIGQAFANLLFNIIIELGLLNSEDKQSIYLYAARLNQIDFIRNNKMDSEAQYQLLNELMWGEVEGHVSTVTPLILAAQHGVLAFEACIAAGSKFNSAILNYIIDIDRPDVFLYCLKNLPKQDVEMFFYNKEVRKRIEMYPVLKCLLKQNEIKLSNKWPDFPYLIKDKNIHMFYDPYMSTTEFQLNNVSVKACNIKTTAGWEFLENNVCILSIDEAMQDAMASLLAKSKPAFLELLIKKGANVNAIEKNEFTALHKIFKRIKNSLKNNVSQRNLDMNIERAKILLEHGADANLTIAGVSPFDILQKWPESDVKTEFMKICDANSMHERSASVIARI